MTIVITFQLSFKREFLKGGTKIPNFKKAKFSQLSEAIGLTNWDKVIKNKNKTTKWEICKSIVTSNCERYIPYRNKRLRNNKKPMCINGTVKKAINDKKKAYKSLKQEGSQEALINYKEKSRICKKLIKFAKLETERLIAKESKTNPKMFFNI